MITGTLHPDGDGCATARRMTRVWHGTYVKWIDHRDAGHELRAALWGKVADALARFA